MQEENLKFERIYNEFKDAILAYIKTNVREEADAWDIFQEVFTIVYKKVNTLNENKNIRSYIYMIAKNKIIDFFRKSKKETYFSDLNYEPILVSKENFNEKIIDLNNALSILTNREREVFEMKHFFGFKIREIAKEKKLAEGTIKRYLFDAVLKLKEELK